MESKQSRRHFLMDCAKSGAACCALLAWNRSLAAKGGAQEKQEQKLKPIDFSKLSYCGFPCVQVCELYKATLENDEKAKSLSMRSGNGKRSSALSMIRKKCSVTRASRGTNP